MKRILTVLFTLITIAGFSQSITVTVGGSHIEDTTGFVLVSSATTISGYENIILDTEGGVALDTVITLTGVIGQIVYISTRNSGRDITFLDSDNFSLGAIRVLDNVSDVLVLRAVSAIKWKEICFANND